MAKSAAALQLQKELKEVVNDPLNDYCKVELENDSLFEWNIWFLGPPGTDYEGGIFHSLMTFPPDYPFSPPSLKLVSDFWHPNVYKNGPVCISILHTPDPMNPDENGQNWTPAQRVETVIISVISMLSDPNFSSPANIDASVELRKDPVAYRARIRKMVERSLQELPPGFEMPKPKKITRADLSSSFITDDYDDIYDEDAEEDDGEGEGEEEEEPEEDEE